MPTLCPSCGKPNIEGADLCANCGEDLRGESGAESGSPLERLLAEKPLTALEWSKVHQISPDTTLEDAIFALSRQKLDIVLVVDNGELVGVLSVRDVLVRVGANYADKLRLVVRDFMTAKPEVLSPDSPIVFAINKMDVGGCRHVPVVEQGKPIGLVSVRNVVRYIVRHGRAGAAEPAIA